MKASRWRLKRGKRNRRKSEKEKEEGRGEGQGGDKQLLAAEAIELFVGTRGKKASSKLVDQIGSVLESLHEVGGRCVERSLHLEALLLHDRDRFLQQSSLLWVILLTARHVEMSSEQDLD